jgi:cytochrome b6-f complex iron-sulfur subunit
MSSKPSELQPEQPAQRRNFLGLVAMGSFFGAILAAIAGSLKLTKPAVFAETSSRFPIGKPEDFPLGSATNIPSRRLWVFSDESGLAVVSAVCPHLGCVVSREENSGFICPCHGSKFDASGHVMSGPSPRGLSWVEISLGHDGRLVVDMENEVSPDTRFKV